MKKARAKTFAILAVCFMALSVVPAGALPTPGLSGSASQTVLGRVFPEAMQTNDYISYDEARQGLDMLAAAHSDLMKVIEVGPSVGWVNAATGQKEPSQVIMVEMTNTKSAIAREDKIVVLYMLSIHGNEKGGREGGLRVIEDLVTTQGIVVAKPELKKYLDYMILLFLFPNPDGWTHEEAEYRANCPGYFPVPAPTPDGCIESQNFVRVNGNGVDLNRQGPTVGWSRGQGSHASMSQPESQAYFNYIKANYDKIDYATDIHGMLQPADGDQNVVNQNAQPPDPMDGAPNPDDFVHTGPVMENDVRSRGHFVLTMLPAGRFTPSEMVDITSLAELVKERLNADPAFTEWSTLPQSGVAWGGEFNEWGTVWDTIGYTDSGFSSDFFAQDQGLNAPGVDFELAYNHVTFDNYYPGLAARINAYHVEAVRIIVSAFMDQAAKQIKNSIETNGKRTAYLDNPKVVTNADDGKPLEGWAKENPFDDTWDLDHIVFQATPNDYFADLKPFVADGDRPGVLMPIVARELATPALSNYDNLIVAGSAAETISGNAQAITALKDWVSAGGNLVVTDSALTLLGEMGIVPSASIHQSFYYAGCSNLVREHALNVGVRGLARMLYEPVPLGYTISSNSAPGYYFDLDAMKGAGADIAGYGGAGQGCVERVNQTNLGIVKLGSGKVTFIGAMLPDPSEEFYHPYGLDSYATTYSANQILRNALGWEQVYAQPPKVLDDLGKEVTADLGAGLDAQTTAPSRTPGFETMALVLAGAFVALAGRRKRSA
ncbi:MAG: hypothetical protein HY556_02920 [Euryarchaeota archaeon]|nr:hypothetical protein [Euryarchaeota archaeon]